MPDKGPDELPIRPAWKVGPFVVAPTISVTGLLTIVMAFTAMVGGWYKFDYRQEAAEARIETLEQSRSAESEQRAKLIDTLNRTNSVLGAVVQALEDKGIHVRAHLGDGASE
jgi:hypothetical protein